MARLPHATLIDLDDTILPAYARPSWHRVANIRLEGTLGDEERAQMRAANTCPFGRPLGLSADMRTNVTSASGPRHAITTT
ncbi:hypothetical protein CDS [Bradyrhizobium sp.]|nr:hypothetical protein CDS [Bradyrhizobium sp.]